MTVVSKQAHLSKHFLSAIWLTHFFHLKVLNVLGNLQMLHALIQQQMYMQIGCDKIKVFNERQITLRTLRVFSPDNSLAPLCLSDFIRCQQKLLLFIKCKCGVVLLFFYFILCFFSRPLRMYKSITYHT